MRRHIYLALLLPILITGCRSNASPGPVITIEADYPGADAQTVADAVAGPIETQVNGVENARYVRARCGSDGRCSITVAFAAGTDVAMAQVRVQNRMSLALPVVPQQAQQAGIAVRTQPWGVAFMVALSSPAGRFDTQYLSHYAAVNLKDEFARLTGVGSVMVVPEVDDGLRLWLDPAKLDARGLTVVDVAHALAKQNFDPRPLSSRDNATSIAVGSPGRRVQPKQCEEVIVKVDGGNMIHVRDVGRVEPMVNGPDNVACLNSKDVVLLAVAPHGTARLRDLQSALADKVAELAKRLPDGARLELAFDFTTNIENPGERTSPEYLVLDVDAPADAAPAPAAALRDIARALASVEGMQDVLTLTDNPFDGARGKPCVLVRLAPMRTRKATREQLADSIRTRLEGKPGGATVRVRFPLGAAPFTGWSYPIQLAIHGPNAESVRKLAAKLAERLRTEGKLTDVWLDPATEPRPQLSLDIDRAKIAALGLNIAEVNEFLRFQLPAMPANGKHAEDIKQLKIRSPQGPMVPLAAIATVRIIEAPAVVDRLDGKPMVAITANPAAGEAVSTTRTTCERLAGEVRAELQLPADYRLTWLRDLPR